MIRTLGTAARIDPGLAAILRDLWPEGGDGGYRLVPPGSSADHGPVEHLLALPSAGATRFLISDVAASPTFRLLTSHNGTRTRRRAAQRLAVAWYLRLRLPRRFVSTPVRLAAPPPTFGEVHDRPAFPDHLRDLLGAPDACLAIGIRDIEDSHDKPMVQVFTADGRPQAYAKLGWNDGTATMVRQEIAALTDLAAVEPRGVRFPRLLHHGHWGGRPFLVMAPLPGDVRRLRRRESPREAARAVAGEVRRVELVASAWWAELARRLESVGSRSSELAESADRARAVLAARADRAEWDFGAWHGDWTWWNVGRSGGEIVAWDWEHYARSAPVGFDDLHWSVTLDRQIRNVPLPAALARAQRQLPPPNAAHGDLLVLAYLTEMAVRSCEVSSRSSTPRPLHAGLLEELRIRTAQQG